jgi:hypothetical protein
MRSQLLRSRRESLSAEEIFQLIKDAEKVEEFSLQYAYVCGAEDVQDANLYGYERRFAHQFYNETYGGKERDQPQCKPGTGTTIVYDPVTGKTYTPEKGGTNG